MQRNNKSKKRIISASIAGLLTMAVVSTALYENSSVAYARPSLPGIEGIVNSNSADQPFKILEIVDDYPSARTGFTVANEEPADVRNADAISDMASLDERADRFMTETTTTSGTAGYKELEGYAFTYDTYLEKDDDGVPFDKDTENAKNGKSFGSFKENADKTGRYDPADISGDYKQVNDNTTATEGNLTIDEVYRKVPGSDQTGLFYMHYAGVLPANSASVSENRYDVTQFEEIDSDSAWKYPFMLYSEDTTDGEGNNVTYTYYDQNRYVIDLEIEANYDPKDVNVAEDDEYTLLSELKEGDVIYIDTAGDTFLEYAGFISKNSDDDLIYIDKDGNEYPLQGAVKEAVVDTDGNPVTDADGNPTYNDVTSLAYIISESTDTYCTVKVSDGSDGAAITKYHISKMVQNDNGLYERFSGRFQPVNDPAYSPETFGIIDENEAGYTPEGDPWYHVWYYKAQSTAPYIYNKNDPQDGTHDFVHNYSEEEVDNYYYKGGFTNAEKFKREVLDIDNETAKLSAVCIDVITKKLQDVTAQDIIDADLIYFTGNGNYDEDTSGAVVDMNYEAASALITAVDKDKKAVIIDLTAVNAGKQFRIGKNMANAVLLLLQNDIDGISKCVGADDWKISEEKSQELNQLKLEYYSNAATESKDTSHVINSVFVNDNLEDRTEAVAKDFETEYSSDKVDGFYFKVDENTRITYDGFKEVKKDHDEEKFYLEVAGKDVSKFNDKINKATSIRYILNFGNRRTVSKNTIRVLDIEPFYARDIEGDAEEYTDNEALKLINKPGTGYKNGNYTVTNIKDIRDIFTKSWFRANVISGDTARNIEVTGMGTREFIGKIEDLNENYDLIYIGMDTAYLNTELQKTNKDSEKIKTKNVVGNQSNFHYVYSHTGDTLSPEKTSNYTSIAGAGTWNMSGNDITPDKLRELQNYVKSGYAVILSDEFFTYNTDGSIKGIDTNRIEDPSYMRDFIDWILTEKNGKDYKYLYKNVDVTRNFEATVQSTDKNTAQAHRDTFINYLNISKLQLEVIEQPLLYNPYNTNSNDVHYYLGMNTQGKYTLDYKIKLTNDAAVDTTNTSYDCRLYIDHDADGRFENVEALDSLEIINNDNGDYINPQDDGRYHLTTGTTYSISREVPEGYVGLIPWKLVFVENRGENDAEIKTAVQDYSAISDLTNKPTIRVLQLTQDQYNGNDETNPKQPTNGINSNNYNHLNLRDDARLKELYGYVTEFNIKVDKVWVRNFVRMNAAPFNNGRSRLENLNDYDIVVLGFSDSYRFTPDKTDNTGVTLAMAKEAILSLREYALSGKSILFTHDLTSPTYATDDRLDYNTLSNRYLRDIQGMDRYGYIAENVSGLTFEDGTPLTEYVSVYDTRFRSGDRGVKAVTEKIGFTNQTMLRWNKNSVYGDIAAAYTHDTEGNNSLNRKYTPNCTDERQMYSVKRLNRGQMTEYPFRIGSMTNSGKQNADGENIYYANEYIETAQTHHQWFQLDLETDYTDDNHDDDVVVWYTLTAPGDSFLNYHKLDSDDARNNYYIFNKGNITYTGAGHWWINGDEEKKLFVNTLVASYNAGKHAPYAAYKSDDTIIATDITSTYIPYDIAFSQSEADGGEGDGWIEPTVTVYFKTVNNNLQDNKMPLITQYYVEVPSGGDITIGTSHYKIVQPKTIQQCTVIREGTVSKPVYRTEYTNVDDSRVLANGKVYKLEFDVNDLMPGNTQGVNTRYHAKIYTRMRSQDKKNTIDYEKSDMDNVMTVNGRRVDSIATLPANDSFKPLNINFTQLYDLK